MLSSASPRLRQAREEPCRQRQFGVLHQTARGQRGLVSAAVALKQPAGILAEDAVIGAVATRATESIEPSRLLDRLGAEALKEFRNGHAVLVRIWLKAMECTPL